MARQTPRLCRLPQRLDYILIPAPHDFSLPSITEKSTLPAIIVTPSSPIHTQDFSIAFLAPPPKPSLRERVSTSMGRFSPSWLGPSRSFRTTLILTLLFLVMIMTHLITHQFATYSYPRLDVDIGHHGIAPDNPDTPVAVADINTHGGDVKAGIWNWIGFELKNAWGIGGGVVVEKDVFVFVESTGSGQTGSLPSLE